jgi:hypothetical protein
MDITEIQDELLHLEYPNLLSDHDPDIERYYYLRSTGQSRDALAIYQYRLRPRYPDDEFRTLLLRSYRRRDPAFRGLLTKGYRMLGERSLDRIKNIIFYIAEKAESFNEKDVYSTIRTAEDILRFLPQERYEAVAGIDRFYRYAAALNLKERSIAKASELVRAYLTDTLSIVEEERRRRSEADRKAMEQERRRLVKADYDSYLFQKKFGYRPHLIDLSSVVFSEVDLARIEIPPFQRIEDQVLAYCIKYWNMVNDPAFERILFLYSRKYGRKNYDVFIAIRRGRMAKRRDDEILASIVSVLVTGYYYSIQGDIYLQRSWNTIKNALQNQVQSRPALPPPPQTRPAGQAVLPNKTAKAARLKIAPRIKLENTPRIAPKVKTVSKTAVVAKPVQQPAAKPAGRPTPGFARSVPAVSPPVKVPAGLRPAREQKTTIVAARPLLRSASVQPAQPARPASAPVTQRSAQPAKATQAVVRPAQSAKPAKAAQPVPARPLFAPLVPASPPPKPRKQKVFSTSLEKARGSVSDRLKELSGRSYDVYEDRFLAGARNAIRKVLETGKGLFFNLPEEAEDLVFGFLRDNYSNHYMNWEDSAERKNLLSMGFDLPSIIPVIDECYRTL